MQCEFGLTHLALLWERKRTLLTYTKMHDEPAFAWLYVKYAGAWSALSVWQVIKSASPGSSFTPGGAGAGPRPRNGVQGEHVCSCLCAYVCVCEAFENQLYR